MCGPCLAAAAAGTTGVGAPVIVPAALGGYFVYKRLSKKKRFSKKKKLSRKKKKSKKKKLSNKRSRKTKKNKK